jgi:lipoyl(octanoyl) transferase
MIKTDGRYLGTLPYSSGLEAQAGALCELDHSEFSAIVLGLEHPPVITLGVRGARDIDLELPEAEIAGRGFEVVKTDRGGQATLHNPGQLVIYPICHIKNIGLGVRDYVCLIEKSTGAWLSSIGVQWSRQEREPGIFVGEKKLVALGFRIAHGKTSHGIAINVENNLEHFGLIRTCGIAGQPVTSLSRLGLKPSEHGGIEGLFNGWMTHFNAHLAQSEPNKACQNVSP